MTEQNNINRLCIRESVPVLIGTMTLYCENFKMVSSAEISEQPTVSGDTVTTNRFRKSSRITFTGRVYDDGTPMYFATFANFMRENGGFYIEYRGLKFEDCNIISFIIEDKGDNFAYVTITVSTAEPITIMNGVDAE